MSWKISEISSIASRISSLLQTPGVTSLKGRSVSRTHYKIFSIKEKHSIVSTAVLIFKRESLYLAYTINICGNILEPVTTLLGFEDIRFFGPSNTTHYTPYSIWGVHYNLNLAWIRFKSYLKILWFQILNLPFSQN